MGKWVNEGTADRAIRVVLGLVLLYLAYGLEGTPRIVLGVLGVAAIVTGALGVCGAYYLFGINTCKVKKPAA